MTDVLPHLLTERRADLVVSATAVYSPCRTYRYALTRQWGDGPAGLFVMLNPSTATAHANDPTVRRCLGFAAREGWRALAVVNLFGLRSTDPAALAAHPDPIGEHNDQVLADHATRADVVVAAWGGRSRRRRHSPARQHHAAVPGPDHRRAPAASAVRARRCPAHPLSAHQQGGDAMTGEPALIAMIGPCGAGKTTATERIAPPGAVVVSLDEIRAQLSPCGCSADQSVNAAAVDTGTAITRTALATGRTVVWDTTAYLPRFRSHLLDLAAEFGARAVGLVVLPPLDTVLARNGRRDGTPCPRCGFTRRVPDKRVREMHHAITTDLPTLPGEGWHELHHLTPRTKGISR